MPVTEEVSVTLPLPTFTVSVGLAGFGGRVGNADAAASSVAQAPSLYALKVYEVFAVRSDTVVDLVDTAVVEHCPPLGEVYW